MSTNDSGSSLYPDQVSGPGWLDTERYDIIVKVPAGAQPKSR